MNTWFDYVKFGIAVTGASCGYAFVEFETEREMRRAYEVISTLCCLFHIIIPWQSLVIWGAVPAMDMMGTN